MLASHPSCMLTSAVSAARDRTVMKGRGGAAPRAAAVLKEPAAAEPRPDRGGFRHSSIPQMTLDWCAPSCASRIGAGPRRAAVPASRPIRPGPAAPSSREQPIAAAPRTDEAGGARPVARASCPPGRGGPRTPAGGKPARPETPRREPGSTARMIDGSGSLVRPAVRRKYMFPRPRLPFPQRAVLPAGLGSAPTRRPAAGPDARKSPPADPPAVRAPGASRPGQSPASTASTNAPIRWSGAWTTCSGPGEAAFVARRRRTP